MHGTVVRSLVWEDPFGCRATKPMHHKYLNLCSRARKPQRQKPVNTYSPCSTTGNGKPTHQTPPERASEARKIQHSQKKKNTKLILNRELTYGPGERGAGGEMYEESNTETYVIIHKVR